MKFLGLCIMLFLLLGFSAQAQESYQEFERGLNLSDTQRQQIDGIRRKYTDEWRTLNNESVRKRLELQGIDRNSDAGREQARRLENDLNSIHTTRGNLYRQYRGEVSGVLNDQQRGRYDRFLSGERQRGMMGPPGQRGMMPYPAQRGTMPPPGQRMHGR